VTTCAGQDGTYEELRQTFSGPSTADDPQVGNPYLTGTLFVRSKLLRKVDMFDGTVNGAFSGTAYLISTMFGTVTVVGRFLGATDGALGAGGVYAALVTGPNPPSGVTDLRGKLIGNFDITMGDPQVTTLSGTFGGIGNPLHPAVVVQGFCEQDADDTQEEVE